jgi:hypothetical protein
MFNHETDTQQEERIMETANAFNMLILPVFQCTAGIFAFFAVIRLFQIVLEDRIKTPRSSEPETTDHRPVVVLPFRPALTRANRDRTRSLSVSR